MVIMPITIKLVSKFRGSASSPGVAPEIHGRLDRQHMGEKQFV